VAGEALIDLVPAGNERTPVVGGGAANTAKALARLGIPTSFIGGISTDEYGRAIASELNEVELGLVLRSDMPTALAIVSLDESGSASYEFKLADTATFDFHESWLPSGTPEVVHVGTLATIVEPGASALFAWASKILAPIVFDPNIRPSVLNDRDKYRNAVAKWAGIAKVLKLSEEDIEWLGYQSPADLLEMGPELVVLTRGAEGMVGYTREGLISVPGVKVKVADTVGAGDTVGAVLVEGIVKYGFSRLKDGVLFEVLNRAAKAAAITCSRVGANPPRNEELD
jgi:fructokinase